MASKTVILGILQNAWSPLYAGETWPRDLWLKALERSRSGKRISVIKKNLHSKIELYFDNTTPIVGDSPDSIVEPDIDYMRSVILNVNPKSLIAFGKQAQASLAKIDHGLPTLILPHPTYRLVHNNLFTKAGEILSHGFNGIVRLRPERDEPRYSMEIQ